MTLLNSEPKLEKNYLIALILSMAVLLTYPFLMKTFFPAQAGSPESEVTDHKEAGEPMPGSVKSAPVTAIEKSAEEPAKETPVEKETSITYENELYDVAFSTRGAAVTHLRFKGIPGQSGKHESVFFEQNPGQSNLFALRLLHEEKVDLSQKIFRFNAEARQRGIFEFVYEEPGRFRLTKQYVFSRREPILSLDLTIENLTDRTTVFPFVIDAAMHAEPASKNTRPHEFEVVAWTDKVVSANLGKIEKKGFQVSKEMNWAGVVKKYFTLLIKTEHKMIGLESRAEDRTIWAELLMDPIELAGKSKAAQQIFIYAGPQRYESLNSFNVGFENILSRGFFGIFKIWLLRALKLSHNLTGNFGWDIILLTFLIKFLFSPLTHMSYRSMEKMKAIQPKLKAVQEKYKNDAQKLNKEMMELYKKHKVNPMGGCLPMVLQIPVFIAFYQVLNEAIELNGAPFIGWIHDLAAPDALFHFPAELPILGASFNLLPILMLISMFAQQKMTPQAGATTEQQKMFQFMPLIFGFIFYKMPSGLVLYWFVNNLLSIAQQMFVRKLASTARQEQDE